MVWDKKETLFVIVDNNFFQTCLQLYITSDA